MGLSRPTTRTNPKGKLDTNLKRSLSARSRERPTTTSLRDPTKTFISKPGALASNKRRRPSTDAATPSAVAKPGRTNTGATTRKGRTNDPLATLQRFSKDKRSAENKLKVLEAGLMKLNGIVPAKAGGAGAGVVIAGAGKGGAVGGLRGTGGVEGYKGGGIRKAGGTGKKGKTFVEDTEAMMEILEMVNVGKEKVIETKLEKGRQLEALREARREEQEKREEARREKLNTAKDAIRSKKKGSKGNSNENDEGETTQPEKRPWKSGPGSGGSGGKKGGKRVSFA